MDTGAQVFEYGCAHGESAITCMAFDTSGRRLLELNNLYDIAKYEFLIFAALFYILFLFSPCRLVTGGRDGCLKMWNFNNGQCVKILSRGQ